MTVTPRQRWILAFALANLLIILIGWFAVISPQRQDAASVAAQAAAVRTELATLTGTQGPNKQPAIHTSELYTLDTALPAQLDEPDLVFQLDQLAKASAVSIVGVTPQPAQASTGFTVLPINLQLNGTYFHLTHFLRTLRTLVSEKGGRLVANGPVFGVTSVTLTPNPTGTGKKKTHDETAAVGMAAFYYGIVGGAAPPASTTSTDTTTTTGG